MRYTVGYRTFGLHSVGDALLEAAVSAGVPVILVDHARLREAAGVLQVLPHTAKNGFVYLFYSFIHLFSLP